jgi:hypothetical protein
MPSILAYAVGKFGNLLVWLLVARAILSWFAADPYSSARKIYDVVVMLTEPIVAPCRSLLSKYLNTGMFDFSLLAAVILVQLVTRLVLLAIYNFMM